MSAHKPLYLDLVLGPDRGLLHLLLNTEKKISLVKRGMLGTYLVKGTKVVPLVFRSILFNPFNRLRSVGV